MASISMSKVDGWVGPAWVLRAIASGMQKFGSFPSLRESFEAVEEGVQYLDLTELPEEEAKELRRVAPLIVMDAKKAGPQSLSDPKFYPGYIDALVEFEQSALSKARNT